MEKNSPVNQDPFLSLKKYIEFQGISICRDKRRIVGILHDFYPSSAEGARNILVYALEEGLVDELLYVDKSNRHWELVRLSTLLSRRRGMKESLAWEAICRWAVLTGYIREDEIEKIQENLLAHDCSHPDSPFHDGEGFIFLSDVPGLKGDSGSQDARMPHFSGEKTQIQGEENEVGGRQSYQDLMNTGNLYREEKKFKQALRSYTRAIQKKPASGEAWRKRGEILIELALYRDADEALDLAISCNPDDTAAKIGKGKILINQGHYQKALSFLVDIVKNSTPDYEGWVQVGRCYLGMRCFPDAINAFQQHLQHHPLDIETRFQLGIAYEKNGDFSYAIQTYDEIIRLNPDNQLAWFNKGRAFEVMGMKDESEKAFARFRVPPRS